MKSRRVYLGALIVMALFLTLGSGFYVMSNMLSAILGAFVLAWLWTKLSLRGISAGGGRSTGAGAGGRTSGADGVASKLVAAAASVATR